MIIGLVLMFTGCSGNEDTTTEYATPGQSSYDSGHFTISVPQDWEVVERASFTSNVPIETVVGFRSNLKSEIFTANVSISETPLPPEIGSQDFAKSSVVSAQKRLNSYQQLSLQDHEFQHGETSIPTYIVEFSGKQSPIEPIVQFKQLFVVESGVGYTITGAFLPNEQENIVKQIDAMLDSFSLK